MKKNSRFAGFYMGLIFFLMYLPIAVVIVFSFNESKLPVKFTGFSLKWYQELFHDRAMLEALVRRLETDKMNGGVSPMLKYSYAPDTLQYAGFTPFSPITLRNASIGFNEKDQPQYRMARETASLHGAAMMVPRHVLQQIGPMTEVYFLFYEEFDWSARMHRAGYKLWYEPAAVVYHKESMTARKGTPLREFYLSRARILYARRNISGGKKILSCLYLSLIAAPKKAVMYLLHGKCRLTISVLHGTLQGLITSKL